MKSFKILLLVIISFAHQANAQDLSNLKTEKLLNVSGNIGLSTTGYSASGIAARRVPFSWMANANLNLKVKGFELPFSFLLTEQQRDFRQPFNQFGLSPKFKKAQFHLGWRNLAYSNYTLNNFQFLGVGADVKLGKFSAGAMYGRLLKAISEDSSRNIPLNGSQVPFASYNRFAYAANIAYGTSANYVKLIFLKGKDDSNSLLTKPIKSVTAPAENAVFGVKSKITLAKKFIWDVDAAFSAYTRDSRAANYPTEGEKLLENFSFLYKAKLSSSYYYAAESNIGWEDKQFGLTFKYQHVLPDYKSFGTYFVQSDVDRKTINARWNNEKNTLGINGSFGVESDNLTGKKLAKTKRNVGSFNLSYNPNQKFGLQATFMNYGTTQSPGLKSISDTTKLDQVTNSIIIVPRYTITTEKMVHNFVLNLSNQQLNDRNTFNSQNFEMNVKNATLSYALSLLSLGYSFDVSPFFVSSKNIAGTTDSYGASLGASKSFLDNRLSTNINASYSTNTFNNANNGNTLQARGGCAYKLNKSNRIQMQLSHVINNSKNQLSSRSFSESTGMLQYTYTF